MTQIVWTVCWTNFIEKGLECIGSKRVLAVFSREKVLFRGKFFTQLLENFSKVGGNRNGPVGANPSRL